MWGKGVTTHLGSQPPLLNQNAPSYCPSFTGLQTLKALALALSLGQMLPPDTSGPNVEERPQGSLLPAILAWCPLP